MTFLYFWQHFYELTDRVAFCVGPFCVHYYALCYIAALLLALFLGKRYARYFGISAKECDDFFIYLEIGIILGARLGYVFIYSAQAEFYLTHPWQIFNPFDANGEFVGISGMSYHGACVGAVLGAWIFARRQKGAKRSLWLWLDLVAISAPLAYTLGRFGNFLNHELFGRLSDVPWAVYVDGLPRHPSQLYEAFFEGFCVWLCMRIYLKFKLAKSDALAQCTQNPGDFIILYAALYSCARFVCEFWRQPDVQLGNVLYFFSMGQILSAIMFVICFIIFILRLLKRKKYVEISH